MRRRSIIPILILLVAGGLALMGRSRTTEADGHVQRYVERLVEDAAADPPVRLDLRATDPLVSEIFRKRLNALGDEVRMSGGEFVVETRRASPGDAAADYFTHLAVVTIAARPRLKLRLRHDGEAETIAVISVSDLPEDLVD